MLGEGPLEEKFAVAKEAGFDGMDIRGDELAHLVGEVRELIDRTGLEVPTIYGRLTTPLVARLESERREAMTTVRRRLRDAATVGAANVIVVPVFGEARLELDWPGGIEEAELALLAVELSELAAEAEEARVRIVLEPLNHSETHLIRSAATAAELGRRIGSEWITTMVDSYHLDLEGQDPVKEVEAAGERLQLVHVADRERRLPGQGGMEFQPLLGALAARGYDGYLGFECRGVFGAEALASSASFMRAAVEAAAAARIGG
jgi:sugar phosphate isomerase/epimerase